MSVTRNVHIDYLANYRMTTHWLRTLDSPLRPTALRTLGAVQNAFANESFLDELAYATDADPRDLRLKHLEDERAVAVVRAVTEQVGWDAFDSV